jgi:hypothetical protein
MVLLDLSTSPLVPILSLIHLAVLLSLLTKRDCLSPILYFAGGIGYAILKITAAVVVTRFAGSDKAESESSVGLTAGSIILLLLPLNLLMFFMLLIRATIRLLLTVSDCRRCKR